MQDLLNAELWERIREVLLSWLLSTLPAIILIAIITLIALKTSSIIIDKFREFRLQQSRKSGQESISEIEKRLNTLSSILKATARIAIWAIATMIILRSMGVAIGPILAGAGILGLAVGFGAQELVRDVISGFFILLENHLRAGDVAIINGTGGLVESIGLRTIVLRDFSGVVHIFQNGKIDTLSNMTLYWSASVLDIGVAYKEDVDHVMQVMRDVATELESDEQFSLLILEPLEIVGVDKFADSAVVIRARYKTQPIQQWAVGREYRRRLKKAFDQHGIEIPFPHTTFYWGENSKPVQLASQVSGGTMPKS